jgi:hypothetical protein
VFYFLQLLLPGLQEWEGQGRGAQCPVPSAPSQSSLVKACDLRGCEGGGAESLCASDGQAEGASHMTSLRQPACFSV